MVLIVLAGGSEKLSLFTSPPLGILFTGFQVLFGSTGTQREVSGLSKGHSGTAEGPQV